MDMYVWGSKEREQHVGRGYECRGIIRGKGTGREAGNRDGKSKTSFFMEVNGGSIVDGEGCEQRWVSNRSQPRKRFNKLGHQEIIDFLRGNNSSTVYLYRFLRTEMEM